MLPHLINDMISKVQCGSPKVSELRLHSAEYTVYTFRGSRDLLDFKLIPRTELNNMITKPNSDNQLLGTRHLRIVLYGEEK